MPSVSFKKQIEENNKEIILKKLSTEIIMGKTTEDTAMELDTEGGASFEQLQDLIKKNAINEIRSTALRNRNTTNYRIHSKTRNRKKTYKRGANVAPRTKRNRHPQVVEWSQTNMASQQQQDDGHIRTVPDPYENGKEKPTIPTAILQTTIP